MNNGLNRKLAFGNIRKNRRFFIPRIVTETGLLGCFYIIYTLACDTRLASVKGGSYLPTFMWMGAIITALLSAILMLYTNSFLMKQRKREFGLYSVLGMEKKHICRVLFNESLICSILSIALGLFCGILFYKLSSLAICKLLKAKIVAGFYYITPKTVIPSVLIFIAIDVFAFVVNCLSIRRMKPVELLSSTNVGEKEPKTKWVMLVLGLVTLCAGYGISLTTENPLKALMLFFAAVLLVIAGTYFLFISGSIFVLKALKKREKYYYKSGHMTAVSGLLYRMKQNAVGLASIAVLSTGVLVMISSTFCLYSRTETILKTNYPQDFYASSAFYDETGNTVKIPEEVISDICKKSAKKCGLKIANECQQEYFSVAYSNKNGELTADLQSISVENNLNNVCIITYITEDTYVKLGGEKLGLSENQVALCPYNLHNEFREKSFILDGKKYSISKALTSFPINYTEASVVNNYGAVVSDENVFSDIFASQEKMYGAQIQYKYGVSFNDRSKTLVVGNAFSDDVMKNIDKYIVSTGHSNYSTYGYGTYWDSRESLYGMYGTLLFLGVLLGLVSLFATVLIIYYKQISEGYEDRNRYQIMQKIGMTEHEVKKSIRSQILLVFFLPLVTAGIHIIFAYPILTKLMKILLLDDIWLFAKWAGLVYVVFALVYSLIYKLTAKTYYKIVN